MPAYLQETFGGGAPKVSHTVNAISRGPKGSIRATAVASGSEAGVDSCNHVGGTRDEDDLRVQAVRRTDKIRRDSVILNEDVI